MKKIIVIFISLIIGYALYWCISDYDYRKEIKDGLVGVYKLDIYRTNLGCYKDSIDKYKHLRLTLNADLTFYLSFSVPFMANSGGMWKVRGMNEWSEIVYPNNIVDQLGRYDDGDSIIYINSPTPQISQKKLSKIDKIFFVKIE